MENFCGDVCHALAAGAVETPMVVRTSDDCPVEPRIAKRHIGVRTAPAISFEFIARWPNQQHALSTDMKDAHAAFFHGACVTNGGESHRVRLLGRNFRLETGKTSMGMVFDLSKAGLLRSSVNQF